MSRLWWWLCLTKDKCKHFRLGLRALLNNTLAQTSGYYKKSKQENAATYLRQKYKKKYISRPRVLRRGLMGEVLMQAAREKTTIRFLALRRPTCISFSYSHSPFSIFTYITVYDIPLFPLLIFKHLLFDILICSLLLFSYPASSPQS